MQLVSMRKLLENGVHFGHQTRRWDPKCKPFIYTAKNGVYIINLEKTQEDLQVAYNKLKEIAENGGKVLFVGTKKQAQQIVLDEATRSGSFYINQRWLGGTLTNFRTIQKRIKRLLEINEMETSGTINVYPKKEVVLIRKEATRLDNFLGGIKEMKKLPDAVVVVDPKEDHNAVLEARKLNIPVFGLTDTNCNPAFVDYPIPANDDAIKSIKLIISLLADAIVEAKGGILQDAYQEGEDVEDITMEDVIINVEKHAEEQEKRRKARNEERNRQQNQKGRFNRNSEKRYINKKENNDVKADEAVEAPVEEAPVVEEVVESVEAPVQEAPVEEAPKKRGRPKKVVKEEE
ncbi:MAG: 30S ribosomal protein S2 [Erysipelotrichaceae bacterium]|nr:30S ribosomal protein S2 [Erysipelotrichaceae bacterium]